MVLREIKKTIKKKVEGRNSEDLVKIIGWRKCIDAEDTVKKTLSLIASVENVIPSSIKGEERNSWFWDEVDFEAESHPSIVYGKVYDLMWFRKGNTCLTITYNMHGDSPKYVAYNTGKALPIAKMRNRKEVAEFLRNKMSD